MASNAVIFSVILSLFLLLADARLDPSSAAATVRDQDEKIDVETRAFRMSLPLTAFKEDEDLSRQIAHSLRFPLNHHRHLSLPHHRRVTLRHQIEVPYGDDMVGLSKTENKKKLKKTKKEKCDDDSNSDSDDDDGEIEHNKMMKKKMKKEREEKGGILKWISGFLN